MALQPLWTLAAFSVSSSAHRWWNSLDGDQPVAKPLPTHKQNKRTDMHASSGIRTHDPSVRAGEDGSCLRGRGRPLGRTGIQNKKARNAFVFVKQRNSAMQVGDAPLIRCGEWLGRAESNGRNKRGEKRKQEKRG
jgi:hypothetical protein